MPTRRHIFDLSRDELRQWAASVGEPAYRADQMLEWVYQHRVADWDRATNLSKLFREKIKAEFDIYRSTIVADPAARDGTRKLLLEFPGEIDTPATPLAPDPTSLGEQGVPGSEFRVPGSEPETRNPKLETAARPAAAALRAAPARVECVMIPEDDRRTACISTQVGCPAACAFCASGIDGMQRNLTAGEIVEQIMRLRQTLAAGEELTNVVVMGMGEPLANYPNTIKALRTLNAPWGGGIGARRFTVSTVGLPGRIKELAGEKLQFTLALSLHAPTEELRKKLIPWAQSVTIPELLQAAKFYFDETGREVTFEYILLGGVNDRVEHASELARLAKSIRANVNLIPYNPVPGLPFAMPSDEAVDQFAEVLEHAGVKVHVRRRRGADIEAACGQLRRRRETAAV